MNTDAMLAPILAAARRQGMTEAALLANAGCDASLLTHYRRRRRYDSCASLELPVLFDLGRAVDLDIVAWAKAADEAAT